MPYCQLYYHLIWSTKYRLPLIQADVEEPLYDALRSKAYGLDGTVFALNGMPNHVHMVASIPPRLAVATFVGQVKGVSSSKLNKLGVMTERFAWQAEYGAFSFDRKRLPNYVAYVLNQKQHHADQTVINALEREEGQEDTALHDSRSFYSIDDAIWRHEFE